MNKLIMVPAIAVLSFMLMQCTYNVSMANAQGTNSDVIDDVTTPTTTVDTALTAPLM